MGILVTEQTDNAPPRKRALLICNGEFDEPSFQMLPGVGSDLAAVKRVLSDPLAGFEVTALLDAGFLDVRKAIARICAESGPQDTLLIYYSGSSFRDVSDGTLYLPVRDSSKEFANATTIDTDFVLRHLRHSRCKRFVLLVDGCNAGAFFVNNRGIPDGLYAIMACAADEYTLDTPEGGAFTRAFVEALENPRTDRDGDGQISIDELYESIKAVMARDKRANVPQKWVWNVRDPIHISAAPPGVFLSYAREDLELATTLKQQLEARGFSVWFDLDKILSGDWEAKVTKALNGSRCVLFLMTQNGLASHAVKDELRFARVKGVPLIPLTEIDWPADKIPDWYHFHFGTTHRRMLSKDRLSSCIDDLANAIRDVRPE